jgi:hypothetical protein
VCVCVRVCMCVRAFAYVCVCVCVSGLLEGYPTAWRMGRLHTEQKKGALDEQGQL